MKTWTTFAFAAALASTAAHAAERIKTETSDTLTFQVAMSAPVLELKNIWGDVRVRPGPDGEITVRYTERRSAPDQARYDRSLESMRLRSRTDEQGVYLYVGGPDPENWHDSDRCRHCRAEYQFE
ncbi:MAG: hypothetical protein HKN58_10820, partial [Xanthomonadales bacterium]|nr:hypothetical protein [Xanthomonadales bacterium]